MKAGFPFFIFLLFSGCGCLQLSNGLSKRCLALSYFYGDTSVFATIVIDIPDSFDTLMVWEFDIHGPKKYRFTSTKNCLMQESGGFLPKFCPDSINQFTLEHFYRGPDTIEIDSTTLRAKTSNFIKYHMDAFSKPPENFQSFLIKSHGRNFILMEFKDLTINYSGGLNVIQAMTNVSNTNILVKYEWTEEFGDQRETALKIIRSIKIKEMD